MSDEINSRDRAATRAVVLAGLVVGTLDIFAAIVLTLLRDGNPLGMLRFIASGVFGAESFSGGWLYALYGLVLHYCIAMIWTLIFFFIVGRIGSAHRHRIIAGILYGIVVWLAMNMVVLPLSNTPPLSTNLASALIGMMVLIGAVGLPLAFLAARHSREKEKSLTAKD